MCICKEHIYRKSLLKYLGVVLTPFIFFLVSVSFSQNALFCQVPFQLSLKGEEKLNKIIFYTTFPKRPCFLLFPISVYNLNFFYSINHILLIACHFHACILFPLVCKLFQSRELFSFIQYWKKGDNISKYIRVVCGSQVLGCDTSLFSHRYIVACEGTELLQQKCKKKGSISISETIYMYIYI